MSDLSMYALGAIKERLKWADGKVVKAVMDEQVCLHMSDAPVFLLPYIICSFYWCMYM